MRKVRVVLCVILAMAMVFALFACNKADTPDNAPAGNDGGSQTNAPAGNDGGSQANAPGGNDSGGGAPAASSADIPKSITIGVTGSLGRFIHGSQPMSNWSACDAVYDRIFYIDGETNEVFSEVLEDFYYEDDNTLVLKLKQGVYFSNGEEATAEDLLFSFTNHIERSSVFVSRMGPVNWEQSSIVDDYTLVLKFDLPYPSVLYTIQYLFDKSWADEVGWDSEEWYNPVGSGPYYAAEYVADDHITLRLRDDYWNKDHQDYAVEEWIIRYFPDASTMYMELERGTISWCEVAGVDYSRFLKEGSSEPVGVNKIDMGTLTYFGMGLLDNEYWRDIEVRRAFFYGVDWEEVGIAGWGDLFESSKSPLLPRNAPLYFEPGPYEFNPELAKQILADAGYQPGQISFHFFMMDRPHYRDGLETIQYYCSQIGINVDIDFSDTTTVLTKWREIGGSDGGFMMNIDGSPAYDPVALGLLSFNNIDSTKWNYIPDETLWQMIADAVYCIDADTQRDLYNKLAQYLYDQVLIIPVSGYNVAVGYRTDVFTSEQITKNSFTNQYLWLTNLGRASAW